MRFLLLIALYWELFIGVFLNLSVVFMGPAVSPIMEMGEFSPDADSSMRFYSVFYGAFGCFCGWVARDLDRNLSWVPYLAGCMLYASSTRLLSGTVTGSFSSAIETSYAIETTSGVLLLTGWLLERRRGGEGYEPIERVSL